MSKRISYTETLVRLDERVKTISENIGEIRDSIKSLCVHVNDENEKMDKRITKLEINNVKANTERKTLRLVTSALLAIFTLTFTILGILTYIKVI